MKFKFLFLFIIGIYSTSSYGAISSCEGDDCFFENSRKNKKQEPSFSPVPVVAPPPPPQKQVKKVKRTQTKVIFSGPKQTLEKEVSLLPVKSNLPSYMVRQNREGNTYGAGTLSINPTELIEKVPGVRDGDFLYAALPQKIKASPQAPTPIRVTLLSGEKRGSYLMGKATLDPELKRVFLTFNKFRNRQDDEVYQLEAEGLNLNGEKGIEGEYHTEEGKFFLFSLLTSFLGIFADAQVHRSQTAFGGWTQEPSLGNSALTAGGSTLVQQGARLADRADHAPQYTETEGNLVIQVVITSDPIKKL